jgi:hypothetical protein
MVIFLNAVSLSGNPNVRKYTMKHEGFSLLHRLVTVEATQVDSLKGIDQDNDIPFLIGQELLVLDQVESITFERFSFTLKIHQGQLTRMQIDEKAGEAVLKMLKEKLTVMLDHTGSYPEEEIARISYSATAKF